ncbi:MAG: PBP1A family penicillin-binding protein [Peptococcaceae bacterium]|nr:PBP1A family penicillin-binding protein [Peptococcaceae bacterium]
MSNANLGNRNKDNKNRRIRSMKKGKKRMLFKRVLQVILAIVILGFVSLGAYTIVAIAQTPDWDPTLLAGQKESSIVFDKDGQPVAQLHASENRLSVEYEDIPQLVKDTFIAVEDKRFFEHHGFDIIRIMKSALDIVKSGEVVSGGSTITIQLAKNAFIEDPTALRLSRKIQELVLALQIERAYTKEEILTFYLNRIYLGQSSFGIRTAAQTYFGKELDELNPAEVALLAGLPQAPSAYDPYINPDKAKTRRNIVLSVMKDAGIITESEFEQYKEEPFTFVEQVKAKEAKVELPTASTRNKKHPYYVDYVINELQDKYDLSAEQIFNGGLKIYTTLDTKIQAAAEKAFANPANFPKSVDEIPVQGAMTVLESETGAISAMVGGREYTPMGLNRAWQSKRQPGSTAKPLIVYAPALEHGGYYPGSVFDDMPVKYKDGTGGIWAPENYDTQTTGWRGLITMREAIRYSVNVYAVKLMHALGVDYAWQFGKNNLGLDLKESDKYLSMSLGTFQISTLEMASCYATFANNGVRNEPYSVVKVETRDGKTLVEYTPSSQRVMKETTAYIMNDLLRSVVTSGTGTRASLGNWYICGKTGTTSLDPDIYGNRTGNPDAWFAGYSPKYVGVVWMGYDKDPDKNHYLRRVYGSSYPTTIWKEVMTVAHEGLQVQSSIPRPKGITTVTFDRKSGLLPSSLTPDEFISTEICAVDSVPTSVSDIWIEVKVDPNNPDLIVSDDTPDAVTRICLNLPDRPEDVPWPKDELPYKPPSAHNADKESDPTGITTPPAGDSSIPQISISAPVYNSNTTVVNVPVLTEYDPGEYSLILYIKRPGVDYVETFQPEDNRTKSISYRLASSGSQLKPGSYTFWAALMRNDSFTIGPPSNPVTLNLTN